VPRFLNCSSHFISHLPLAQCAVQPSPLRSGRLTIGKTLTGSIKPLLGRAKTPFFRKLSKFLNRVSASRLRTSHSIPRKLCDYAKLH
jgi:hypothetical protein